MAKLKLSAVPDDRPVKLTVELPAVFEWVTLRLQAAYQAPSGARKWVLRYTRAGKRVEMGLGSVPTPPGIVA